MGGGEGERNLLGLEAVDAAANTGIGVWEVDGDAAQGGVEWNGDGIKGAFKGGWDVVAVIETNKQQQKKMKNETLMTERKKGYMGHHHH